MEERLGIILKALSGFYYVGCGDSVYECRARGIMRKDGVTPLVGDNAVISLNGIHGTVEQITGRRNSLTRPPVANVDRLYIVSSFSNPAPSTLIIDRLICRCESVGIEPMIVFNKCDTGDFAEYAQIYRGAGFDTFIVSCLTGEGMDKLRESFAGGIGVLTGNSGVGKSSLINTMYPEMALETGEISEKLGRGRHTTRHCELFSDGHGGYIADTPGFAAIDAEPMSKDDVALYFREFADYLGGCKFTSCSHTCEKGCAVLDAVHKGKISPSRHESYCAIYHDSASINQWEHKK